MNAPWALRLAGLAAALLAAHPPLPAAEEAPTELDPMVVEGRPIVIPKPTVRYNPAFPMQARHRWEEGCVVLRFAIRPDGKTDDFAVLESNPVGVFEKSVILAVYKWRYEPAEDARTVIEKFEFRNPRIGYSPQFSVASAEARFDRMSRSGPVNVLEMQLKGYRRPSCRTESDAEAQARSAKSSRKKSGARGAKPRAAR